MAAAATAPEPRMKPRRVYHVHTPMLLYSGVSLLVAVGAFHGQNNLLLWAFGLSLGLLAVSGVVSGAMMMHVRVRREGVWPGRAVGEAGGDGLSGGEELPAAPLRVRYVVENTSRWLPVFALDLGEAVDAASLPSGGTRRERRAAARAEAERAASGPAREQTGALAETPLAFVAYVPPGGSVTVESVTPCLRRGRVASSGFLVTTTFPFGLIRKSLRYDAAASAVVRPAAVSRRAAPLVMGLGQLVSQEPDLSQPGAGDEFFALRPYAEGDSPRQIAWRASARARSLVVRQTASASPGAVWVVPWLAGAGADDRERVLRLSAALVEAVAQSGVRVGLAMPAVGAQPGNSDSGPAGSVQAATLPPRSGPANTSRLLDVLSLVPGGAGGPQADALRVRRAPGDRFVIVRPGSASVLAPGSLGGAGASAPARQGSAAR